MTTSSLVMPVDASTTRSGLLMRTPATVVAASALLVAAVFFAATGAALVRVGVLRAAFAVVVVLRRRFARRRLDLGRRRRLLARDRSRLLVVAQAVENRMADAAVGRPLAERDLGDERRLDPVAAHLARLLEERRLVNGNRGERALHRAPASAGRSRCRRRRRSADARPRRGCRGAASRCRCASPADRSSRRPRTPGAACT